MSSVSKVGGDSHEACLEPYVSIGYSRVNEESLNERASGLQLQEEGC